jgi:hypothetical protein
MNNTELIKYFLTKQPCNKKNKTKNLYIKDNILYSYGEHYPLAYKEDNYIYLNNSKYSVTTTRHMNLCKRLAEEHGYVVIHSRKKLYEKLNL